VLLKAIKRAFFKMEYKFFQIQDFIKDDAFIRWVKYGENDAFFKHFY
jgi:hypothetical protein